MIYPFINRNFLPEDWPNLMKWVDRFHHASIFDRDHISNLIARFSSNSSTANFLQNHRWILCHCRHTTKHYMEIFNNVKFSPTWTSAEVTSSCCNNINVNAVSVWIRNLICQRRLSTRPKHITSALRTQIPKWDFSFSWGVGKCFIAFWTSQQRPCP